MKLYDYDLTNLDLMTNNTLIKMNLQIINMGNIINALCTMLINKGICSEKDLISLMEDMCNEEETKELIDKMIILEKISDSTINKLKGESLLEEDIEYIKENVSKLYSEDKVKEILSIIGE